MVGAVRGIRSKPLLGSSSCYSRSPTLDSSCSTFLDCGELLAMLYPFLHSCMGAQACSDTDAGSSRFSVFKYFLSKSLLPELHVGFYNYRLLDLF